ncbi:uncharacterized protein BT62DRAFT_85786 [Guyanagaster necrorhizus]|uniref:Uncharacterized protein n=1 Tax=Guyanagaster necrorhizus TaxID=856835 RepID=A0A9P7VUB4_9AGAR|nr:uncharacterized protein BT62DRAFT_85786 [Guyanagaster necrorhizus MCA 3950]KAG7446768.1 hypothetical protein BT62DRAFT_85786 [Guyanagaster necrorhizus MCA 3950]
MRSDCVSFKQDEDLLSPLSKASTDRIRAKQMKGRDTCLSVTCSSPTFTCFNTFWVWMYGRYGGTYVVDMTMRLLAGPYARSEVADLANTKRVMIRFSFHQKNDGVYSWLLRRCGCERGHPTGLLSLCQYLCTPAEQFGSTRRSNRTVNLSVYYGMDVPLDLFERVSRNVAPTLEAENDFRCNYRRYLGHTGS